MNQTGRKREYPFEEHPAPVLAKMPLEIISRILKDTSLKTVLSLIQTERALDKREYYVHEFYQSQTKISFELFNDTLQLQKQLGASIWACTTISPWGDLHRSVLPDYLPNLRHLEVDEKASEEEILRIVLSTTRLETLDLSKNSKISNQTLLKIAEHCKKLTSLNLDDNTQIGADTIRAVTKNCPELRYLNLSHCDESVTGDLIADISKNCKHLEKLYIDHLNNLIAGNVLRTIATNCKNLKELSICFTTPVSSDEVIEVMKKSALTVLNLNDNRLVLSDSIIELSLHGKELEQLSLAASYNINTEAFTSLATNCKKLKSLDLTCAHVDAQGVIALATNCPTLEHFKADTCTGLTQEAVIALAQSCPNLKELDVSASGLPAETKEIIKAIAPNIEIWV